MQVHEDQIKAAAASIVDVFTEGLRRFAEKRGYGFNEVNPDDRAHAEATMRDLLREHFTRAQQ